MIDENKSQATVVDGHLVRVFQWGQPVPQLCYRNRHMPFLSLVCRLSRQDARLPFGPAVTGVPADVLGLNQSHNALFRQSDFQPDLFTAVIAGIFSMNCQTIRSDLEEMVAHHALSEATVGVAMGAGAGVARESADVVLIGNDLEKFVETVRVVQSCRRIIFQNFYGTLIVDTIGIALAAVGLLNPLLAVFIHVASELTFILNSTRLLPPREKRKPRPSEEVALSA